MRSTFLLAILGLYLALAGSGCSRKSDSGTDRNNSPAQTPTDSNGTQAAPPLESRQEAPKRTPLVVPARTAVTLRLGSDIGSKLSQAGEAVAIPRGTRVTGTVVDAKPLGRFKGGAELVVRLDSINVNGVDRRVETSAKTFAAKGKGKRTAVMTGGGAALGGLIGGLAGGGKGAAIGLAAGAGAGAGGSAFTGNKDIVLPAESALTFELTRSLEIRR
jgi:hypothetical protein